ncbi:methyltransferase domain-containing protein [Bacillus sp. FSL W7-1360]
MTQQNLIHHGFHSITFPFSRSDERYMLKHFLNTTEGNTFFETEKLAQSLFHMFPWCPSWKWHTTRIFVTKMYPPAHRLDKIALHMTEADRENVLGQLMSAVLDMYTTGYAHRDLHAENIFFHENKVRLIDYSFMERYTGAPPPFWESYDITGAGLPSPYNTQHVCFLKQTFAASVSKTLQASLEDAKIALQKELIKALTLASVTFHSQGKRHLPSVFRPYSSFILPDLHILPEKAQRNSTRRLQQFGITVDDLENKTLLDLGSHCGGMIFESQKLKPQHSLGVEFDDDKVHIAKKIAAFSHLKNVHFMQADIDHITIADINKADVVYCLSIVSHLKDPDRLYSLLGSVTKQLLLFEGNARTNSSDVKMKLKAAGFKKVTFLGYCDDDAHPAYHCRPLFKAWK